MPGVPVVNVLRAGAAVFALLPCLAATPSPEPSPATLPEIGRTRANSPACAAMRDLVVPAFAAAQRADARFAETRKALPPYAEIAADRSESVRYGVNREAALTRLGTDAARLLQEAQTIKKALDDPRLAKTSTDQQVQAERAELEQLYAAQRARADALNEFVLREQVAITPHTMGSNRGISPRTQIAPVDPTPPNPVPDSTARPSMPLLTGVNQEEDKRRLGDWGTSIALVVRRSEAEAAVTFLPIAQSCR